MNTLKELVADVIRGSINTDVIPEGEMAKLMLEYVNENDVEENSITSRGIEIEQLWEERTGDVAELSILLNLLAV